MLPMRSKTQKLEKELLHLHLELHRAYTTETYLAVIKKFNEKNSRYVQLTGRIYDPTRNNKHISDRGYNESKN